jgi:hypothetical protein
MLWRLEHLPNNPSSLWFPIIRASREITINVSGVLEEYINTAAVTSISLT